VRELIVGALALVLGVVLGGLLPRAEVRRLEAEAEELRSRECRSGVGSDLASLLLRPPIPTADEPDEPAPVEVLGEPVGDAPAPAPEGAEPAEGDVEVFGEDVEAAKTALRLRTTQARASLFEDAAPDEGQVESFDAAVDDMNDDLHELAEGMVSRFREHGEPTRREAMVFAADVLDVVITAEDRMAESLDPEQLDDVDEAALDPFSYIDPALLDLLSELDE